MTETPEHLALRLAISVEEIQAKLDAYVRSGQYDHDLITNCIDPHLARQ